MFSQHSAFPTCYRVYGWQIPYTSPALRLSCLSLSCPSPYNPAILSTQASLSISWPRQPLLIGDPPLLSLPSLFTSFKVAQPGSFHSELCQVSLPLAMLSLLSTTNFLLHIPMSSYVLSFLIFLFQFSHELETGLRSSASAVSSFNCWFISLAHLMESFLVCKDKNQTIQTAFVGLD